MNTHPIRTAFQLNETLTLKGIPFQIVHFTRKGFVLRKVKKTIHPPVYPMGIPAPNPDLPPSSFLGQ